MKFRHKSRGYAELLKDAGVLAELERRAQAIADAAGGEVEDFYVEPSTPVRKRARVAVVAPYGDSDNRLIRGMDAGRL